MITREELLQSTEYWEQQVQLEIYNCAARFMEEHKMNRTMLAQYLGVSKGFVSQLLSGNYNYSLSKLIEISVKLGYRPDFTFKPLCSEEDNKSKMLCTEQMLQCSALTV